MKIPTGGCDRCGVPVTPGAGFCSRCGNPIPPEAPAAAPETALSTPRAEVQTGKGPPTEEISWEIDVPLLTNQFILYDLLKVWGFSSLFLGLVMAGIAVYDGKWRTLVDMAPVVGAILLGFVGQGLEMRQTVNEEDFRKFAQSQGLKIDQVPDWVLGKHRRFEHLHTQEWLQTGIAALGLAFFVWVGFSAVRPRKRRRAAADGSTRSAS